MSNNIVVLAEARGGKIKRPSREAVTAGKDLAALARNAVIADVIAVVVGHQIDDAKSELAASGADRVIAIEAEHLANYSGDGYARAILEGRLR